MKSFQNIAPAKAWQTQGGFKYDSSVTYQSNSQNI